MFIKTSLLVVDDDPLHHKLIEHLISGSDYHISHQSFLHAADALSYILDNNDFETLPDLILLDLNMPLISGWGFLELFEEMGPYLAKPVDVIILTSSINSRDKERASQYDCVKGFLLKPLTDVLLKDIVNSSLISAKRVSRYYI